MTNAREKNSGPVRVTFPHFRSSYSLLKFLRAREKILIRRKEAKMVDIVPKASEVLQRRNLDRENED